MTRTHWVPRQTKLETPKEKDEANKREVHECGRFVYYESLKRELKTNPINECRCDERLKTSVQESTRLACPIVVYYKSRKREL